MRGRATPAALALAGVLISSCSLAPIDLTEEEVPALRSTVTAADGSLLARLYSENRELVDLEDISPDLVDAVIATEDARFFDHPGYDLRSITRAAIVNARRDEIVQGGSTITQQYVKNVFFKDPPKDLTRKARELRLAIEVERAYGKTEILERYLNTVYFGSGAYGAKAAAEEFFGRDVGRLALHEAALLAALIKAPAIYDPRDHPQRALRRRDYVIDRMVAVGSASEAEAVAARGAPLAVIEDPPRFSTRQPYFVEAVRQEILRDRRLGADRDERDKALFQGGLEVETTLVPKLQAAARRAVDAVLNQPGDPEAALVAIRPSTGQIVAMIAGRDWNASQVNLALGREGGGSGRQSGSAFKPIAAAAALEAGVSLETRYQSAPAVFTFPNAEPWSVTNSEGSGAGLVPLGEATVRSINGVYARLALDIGPGTIATQAKLMGVRSPVSSNYPSIVLGTSQVSVVDIATAYATLANYGTAIEPTTIRRIVRADGSVLEPDQKRVEGAMSPGNAYLLTKVLEQVIQRGTGTAARIGRPAAGKTGTTNDYVDAWFAGYTPDLVAAVWVGYPQGSIPMTSVHGIRVFGGTFPAQIWRAFMIAALEDVPPRPFKIPRSDLVKVEIDPVTGLLAAPWCPGEMMTMLRQLAPVEYCPMPPVPVTPLPLPTVGTSEEPRTPRPGETTPEPDDREPRPEPTRESKRPQPTPSRS
ncbi:MAG TPA: PBP1A family penicillin-binding protein [Actinomycetota bacterium]|nr:PBP1A family penicillin-binding protein [Actinomycetota bacterium]